MVDPYKSLYQSSRKEIDLRQELEDMFVGSPAEIAKGREGLLRKMRRDSEGNLISCACRDKITKDPARDSYCRYCLGMGYYWDEIPIIYFRNEMSYGTQYGQNKEYVKDYFYLRYNEQITDDDYLITLNNTIDGNSGSPQKRLEYFKVFNAVPFRSDNGRIEYWRVKAKEERSWSIWYEQIR
jgi:hypothetical protein